jgi:SAM-dependent methyltransferase
MAEAKPDIWSEWLLSRRQGGDEAARAQVLRHLAPVRDRVLDGLGDLAGGTLLDVGCGDGLIAFGALERWAECKVIFSDVSEYLLEHCREVAATAGVLQRCEFILADAASLEGIPGASVDAVTTRSVLIYVKDKAAAFRSFRRVLREGGRLSLFEPINAAAERMGLDLGWSGVDTKPVRELAERVAKVYRDLQPPDDPMLDFDERDLVLLAIGAGFSDVHLSLEVVYRERRRGRGTSWEQWLHNAPNPRVPTMAEAVAMVLAPEEAERYFAHMRPRVESGAGRSLDAVAYLRAKTTEESPDGG